MPCIKRWFNLLLTTIDYIQPRGLGNSKQYSFAGDNDWHDKCF